MLCEAVEEVGDALAGQGEVAGLRCLAVAYADMLVQIGDFDAIAFIGAAVATLAPVGVVRRGVFMIVTLPGQ